MEKWEKKHHFWAFSRFGTGTKQCGTGTTCVLVDILFWTNVSVLEITWSFLVRIE